MSDIPVNFILPGLYEHFNLNFKILELLQSNPEYFMDNVKISAIYGSFQFCIFDGGRNFGDYKHTTREEIEKIVDIYNNYFKVPIRLVFTNPILKREHYTDRFGNVVMELCENDINEIVVNQLEFEDYVREKYPKFQFISSTTKCLNTPSAFKEELASNRYKMICLDYNLNKNKKLLEELTPEERSKCEFLCNAICPPACKQRKEHYKLNGLYHLSYGKPYQMEECQINYNTVHPAAASSRNNLTPEEIYNFYVPNGYNLFKLEGRTLSTVENVLNYVKYMVKPEYQFYVITQLLPDDGPTKVFLNTL